MSEHSAKNISREERLAAKLRENLRRRKAQARAASGALGAAPNESPTETLPNGADES